jgi:hypothetical protein
VRLGKKLAPKKKNISIQHGMKLRKLINFGGKLRGFKKFEKPGPNSHHNNLPKKK